MVPVCLCACVPVCLWRGSEPNEWLCCCRRQEANASDRTTMPRVSPQARGIVLYMLDLTKHLMAEGGALARSSSPCAPSGPRGHPTRLSRGVPACSAQPSVPERRATAACLPKPKRAAAALRCRLKGCRRHRLTPLHHNTTQARVASRTYWSFGESWRGWRGRASADQSAVDGKRCVPSRLRRETYALCPLSKNKTVTSPWFLFGDLVHRPLSRWISTPTPTRMMMMGSRRWGWSRSRRR